MGVHACPVSIILGIAIILGGSWQIPVDAPARLSVIRCINTIRLRPHASVACLACAWPSKAGIHVPSRIPKIELKRISRVIGGYTHILWGLWVKPILWVAYIALAAWGAWVVSKLEGKWVSVVLACSNRCFMVLERCVVVSGYRAWVKVLAVAWHAVGISKIWIAHIYDSVWDYFENWKRENENLEL